MPTAHPDIPAAERLIVALDLPNADAARALVTELGDAVGFYKIGLELCMAGGYFELLDWLKARGKKVFVDLKFFDVPETVRAAVRALSHRGADMCTVHGNQGMMVAAAQDKGALKVLAVTVLTSLDRGDLLDLGFDCDVERLVLSRARRALATGCDGIVSSGLEAAAIRTELGARLLVVTPGIRPVDNRSEDDQKRTLDAVGALAAGADYLVVGRPIRQAPSPRRMAEAMQAQIATYCAAR
ncbi:MAG: Orotidine 5'-phosphate decarboxylase [Rhodocyclaceae bacterium]|nr:Orotidine 5'-phosphate decarboxylase [Rhodocyclaceae bacterium]